MHKLTRKLEQQKSRGGSNISKCKKVPQGIILYCWLSCTYLLLRFHISMESWAGHLEFKYRHTYGNVTINCMFFSTWLENSHYEQSHEFPWLTVCSFSDSFFVQILYSFRFRLYLHGYLNHNLPQVTRSANTPTIKGNSMIWSYRSFKGRHLPQRLFDETGSHFWRSSDSGGKKSSERAVDKVQEKTNAKSGKRPPEILWGHEQGDNSNEKNHTRKQNVNSSEVMSGKEVTNQLTMMETADQKHVLENL